LAGADRKRSVQILLFGFPHEFIIKTEHTVRRMFSAAQPGRS